MEQLQQSQIESQNKETTTSASLEDLIFSTLKGYFDRISSIKYLSGNQPLPSQSAVAGGVQRYLLEVVESALYKAVMYYTKGNQSEAAKVLGVSRGTLRTKLKTYFGTTHIGLPTKLRDETDA